MIDFIPILTEYLQILNFETGSETIQILLYFFFKITIDNINEHLEFFVKCGTLRYIFHYINIKCLDFDILNTCLDIIGNMTVGNTFVVDVNII